MSNTNKERLPWIIADEKESIARDVKWLEGQGLTDVQVLHKMVPPNGVDIKHFKLYGKLFHYITEKFSAYAPVVLPASAKIVEVGAEELSRLEHIHSKMDYLFASQAGSRCSYKDGYKPYAGSRTGYNIDNLLHNALDAIISEGQGIAEGYGDGAAEMYMSRMPNPCYTLHELAALMSYGIDFNRPVLVKNGDSSTFLVMSLFYAMLMHNVWQGDFNSREADNEGFYSPFNFMRFMIQCGADPMNVYVVRDGNGIGMAFGLLEALYYSSMMPFRGTLSQANMPKDRYGYNGSSYASTYDAVRDSNTGLVVSTAVEECPAVLDLLKCGTFKLSTNRWSKSVSIPLPGMLGSELHYNGNANGIEFAASLGLNPRSTDLYREPMTGKASSYFMDIQTIAAATANGHPMHEKSITCVLVDRDLTVERNSFSKDDMERFDSRMTTRRDIMVGNSKGLLSANDMKDRTTFDGLVAYGCDPCGMADDKDVLLKHMPRFSSYGSECLIPEYCTGRVSYDNYYTYLDLENDESCLSLIKNALQAGASIDCNGTFNAVFDLVEVYAGTCRSSSDRKGILDMMTAMVYLGTDVNYVDSDGRNAVDVLMDHMPGSSYAVSALPNVYFEDMKRLLKKLYVLGFDFARINENSARYTKTSFPAVADFVLYLARYQRALDAGSEVCKVRKKQTR